jgi:hypothetical protein
VGGLLASRGQGAKVLQVAIPTALLAVGVTGLSISKALSTDAHFMAGFMSWMYLFVEPSETERRKVEEAIWIGL